MPFYLLIFPAIVIAAFVLVVFGSLGVCGMTACLGSGNPTLGHKLVGALFVAAASFPFAASMTLLVARVRKVPLGSVIRALIWAVVGLAGAFGVFQVLFDPGDALWSGVPLIVFAALLALSFLEFPRR